MYQMPCARLHARLLEQSHVANYTPLFDKSILLQIYLAYGAAHATFHAKKAHDAASNVEVS